MNDDIYFLIWAGWVDRRWSCLILRTLECRDTRGLVGGWFILALV